jgi:hypothetical protein
MDNIQLANWYKKTLKLDLSKNDDLRQLVEMNIDDLDEDQMMDLIMWIDSSFKNYSLTNGFQDYPYSFFANDERLGDKSPYKLLQDDPK